MKLLEALTRANQAAQVEGEPFDVFLSCSFSPLHLETFLVAHLWEIVPQRRIQVRHGIYGDLHNVQLARDRTHRTYSLRSNGSISPAARNSIAGRLGSSQISDIVESSKGFVRRMKESLSADTRVWRSPFYRFRLYRFRPFSRRTRPF